MADIDPGYIPSRREGQTHERVGPRRWMWWFFVPWFLSAGAAWWMDSDRLADVALVFFGIVCLVAVFDGMNTGSILGTLGEEHDREKDSGSFWSGVALYTLFGVGAFLSVLARWMRP
jgi:hypothetical protein